MIRKLFKDSLSSALVPVVKILITFIMAPIIVHALGNYDYGVWEIVFSIIAYIEFMDMGLIPAIVRNVARYNVLEDYGELRRIYSSSLVFFVPIGLLMACSLLIFSYWAPDYFIKGPGSGSHKYSLFFIIISIQVLFVFIGSVFDCFMEGLQLYSTRNWINIVFAVVGSVAMYPILKNGGGLLSLAIVNACGYSLKFILYGILLSTRNFGGFKFKLKDVSWQTTKGLFTFGFKSLVWSLSLRIASLTDPLIIGAVLGAAVVPFYMIPYNFISQARGLVWSVTRIFLPAFSRLDATGEKRKILKLYFGASRFMLGFIVPLIGGICILGPSFLAHWMGPEYAEKGTQVLYIIAAAHMIQWINPFSRRFLTAIDKHEILARVGIIGALINVGLSLFFVRYIGKEGVALGTLLPLLVAEPYLLYKTCQKLECSVMQYSYSVFLPLVIPTLAFIFALNVAIKLRPVNSILDIVLLAILGLGTYLTFFVILAMKGEERVKVYWHLKGKFFSVKST